MKYLSLTLATCIQIIFINFSAAQTVRIADNNFNTPTGPNIYPTIQEAVDAASPGDFIYIQPSPNKYGDATIDKELHFVGIGFELTKDLPYKSVMNNLTLVNNADNTSNPSNSTFKGIDFTGIVPDFGTTSYLLQNVKFINCIIRRLAPSTFNGDPPTDGLELIACNIVGSVIFYKQATNMIVRNCLIRTNDFWFRSTSPTSAVISNNIIYAHIRKSSVGDNVIIKNNNFIGTKGSDAAFSSQMENALVSNNIFYGRTPSIGINGSTSSDFEANVFNNNISYETGDDTLPPTGGGAGNTGQDNIEATSPQFVDVLILDSFSPDADFTLDTGSPAIGAGSDGTDIGITGGAYPFTTNPSTGKINYLMRPTALPTIEILNTSTVINPGDDLDVRVKATSN
ncbi:MAG: hypothetical protein R3345_14615 [Fulvivirga sp.]|nr:hypothetical protein [Fulvivirga sp.]